MSLAVIAQVVSHSITAALIQNTHHGHFELHILSGHTTQSKLPETAQLGAETIVVA